MELYTGRTVKDTDFNYNYVGLEGAYDQEGAGFYFTDNKDRAYKYARPNGTVITAELKTKKFLTYNVKPNKVKIKKLIENAPYFQETLYNFGENLNQALKEAINSYYNCDSLIESFQTIENDFYKSEGKQYLLNLVKLGYDAHIKQYDDETHYIVYNNKIINILDVEYLNNINESKKIVNKILKEIGDANVKSFPFKNIQDSDVLCRYIFTTDEKINYRVVFENEKLNDETSANIWTLAFGNVDDKKNTIQINTNVNKGEFYKVMSTIVNIIKDFSKRYKGEIDAIAFSGSDERRNNVYIKYIKTQLGLNWKIKAEEGNYFFTPEKQTSALIAESYKLIDQIISYI